MGCAHDVTGGRAPRPTHHHAPALITSHPVGHAFTLIEILVVILVIGILLAILLPVLARARDTQRTMACAANLRSIGVAWQVYADTYRDHAPHAGIDQYVDGQTNIDAEWTATQDIWRGDLEPAAWSGYGILLADRLLDNDAFFCPAAMNGWVPLWHRFQRDNDGDALLIGAIDPAKIGLDGFIAMSTYYQRGVALGAPEQVADPGNRALVADCHFQYDPSMVQNSHAGGLNVLYNDGSVTFVSCPPSYSIAFEGEPDLIDAGWGTWDELDQRSVTPGR